MYYIISHVNTRLRNDMENPLTRRFYTLGEKFQIKENHRALMMARRIVMCAVLYATITTTLFTLFNFKIIPVQASIFTHILENAICLNPLLTCPILMSCSSIWHKYFWNFLPFRSFNVEEKRKIDNRSDEMDIYFKQLKNAWV
ncbi:unnamed protein product [Caenorhabditis angaria]|uniref:Uncharacterized protein n=1 Tax=Caenorhabditis angaria TaxID=860376 RepID=A0A9P1N0D8_9PELO|nr:unnamed protein product [Caenorhabditis angaria]